MVTHLIWILVCLAYGFVSYRLGRLRSYREMSADIGKATEAVRGLFDNGGEIKK